MAEQVDATFGRVDILVNNAGIYPVQPFTGQTLNADGGQGMH